MWTWWSLRRWLAAVALVTMANICGAKGSWSQLQAMYCGAKDCYDLLGVTRASDVAEIKKNFRRLSLQWHPDRNSDSEAPQRFREIAKAYSVLSSPETRSAYNYYLDDPESVLSLYYGFRAVYPAQTNPVLVFVVVLLVLSFLQYVNSSWAFERYRHAITRSDKFKKAVECQIWDTFGDSFNKMAASGQDEARKAAEVQVLRDRVQIDGITPRVVEWRELLAIQVILLPYHFSAWILWQIRWFIRHTVLRQSYGADEEEHLTRRSLGYNTAKWNRLGDTKKAELIGRKLWIRDNLLAYEKEEQERQRETRNSSAKYKQWKRWKKKNPDTTFLMDD